MANVDWERGVKENGINFGGVWMGLGKLFESLAEILFVGFLLLEFDT